jgi:hypothetical protein
MIREGDSFDYNKWLKKVRQEEARAKQADALSTTGELSTAQIDDPINTSDHQDARASFSPALISKEIVLSPKAVRWPHRQAKSKTPKALLRRWLEKVQVAWEDFQSSRRRDAVYEYLGAVFAIVRHYKVRRRTTRLLRHAFEFADLPFDRQADPFTAVIRCTSGGEIDRKTISKWSRALRFAVTAKKSRALLKQFMKKMGGINACANEYGRHFGSHCR